MERLEPETLREILTRAVGADRADRAVPAFFTPASVSVRRHPSKTDAAFAGHFGPGGAPVPWNPLGLLLEKRPSFTLDPLLHAGCYYVQDSSAMYVGEVFRRAAGGLDVPGRPVRVLDLCAAPGGKSTDLAASLRAAFGDGFLLVANEVMRDRAGILADNLALWGDPCTAVTSADPKAFAALEGFFDAAVAVDAEERGSGLRRILLIKLDDSHLGLTGGIAHLTEPDVRFTDPVGDGVGLNGPGHHLTGLTLRQYAAQHKPAVLGKHTSVVELQLRVVAADTDHALRRVGGHHDVVTRLQG
jgi:hypothetical protein